MILINKNYIKDYNLREYLKEYPEEKPFIDAMLDDLKIKREKEVKMLNELNKKANTAIRPRTTVFANQRNMKSHS